MAIGWTVANPRSYCGGDLCAPGAKKNSCRLIQLVFQGVNNLCFATKKNYAVY